MGNRLKEPPLIEDSGTFHPRTSLGRRLWEIRHRHIAKGGRLLSWDEIDARLSDRRGRQDPSR
jgi:hypothetical protein